MKVEKQLLVVYECNVCGEEHQILAIWSPEAEVDMEEEFGKDMATEMLHNLTLESKRVFQKLHPGKLFFTDRLIASQVFEEEGNEEWVRPKDADEHITAWRIFVKFAMVKGIGNDPDDYGDWWECWLAAYMLGKYGYGLEKEVKK